MVRLLTCRDLPLNKIISLEWGKLGGLGQTLSMFDKFSQLWSHWED